MHGTITPLDLAKTSKTYVKAMALINGAIEGFIKTGVAVISGIDFSDLKDDDWSERYKRYRRENTSIASPSFVRAFARKVAQDLKRPIVIAEIDGWQGNRVTVTIKKLKRNEPIAGPFLLTLDNKLARWHKPTKKIPVWGYQDKTNWYFHFDGRKGRRVFEEWLEQCKTDPTFRKALKLDCNLEK